MYVCVGFYGVYHKVASGFDFEYDTHDHSADDSIKELHREELEQFRAVKTAFDESGLLNPGKAIPLPRHCAEYRSLGRDTLTAPSRRGTRAS